MIFSVGATGDGRPYGMIRMPESWHRAMAIVPLHCLGGLPSAPCIFIPTRLCHTIMHAKGIPREIAVPRFWRHGTHYFPASSVIAG